MWIGEYEIEGVAFHMQSGVEIIFEIDTEEMGKLIDARDPRIWDVLRWARENAKELDLVNTGMYEYRFYEGYRHTGMSMRTALDELETIRHSKFADPSEKEEAARVIDKLLGPSPVAAAKQKRERKRREGYVYLLKAGTFYKIGRALNVDERVKHLGTLPPFDIEIIHTIWTDDYRGLESELHKHFDSKRKNGEWFTLNDEDVEYIKALGETK